MRGGMSSTLVLGLVALLCARGQAIAQERASKSPAATSSPSAGYTIGPADVLQIIVWKEPDLTRDVTVRLDGMVTVPLLGEILAAGRKPAAVAESISKGLERFIQAPRVTVGVGQATTARFYVVGQVGKSGEFPLWGRTTVLQGLALAGGFKDFAKTENIVLVRNDQTVVQVNYKRIADGKDASQNLVLGPGDTIVVP
jgi:polysaccharide export outer membrane protein